jgi:hypothetical protein
VQRAEKPVDGRLREPEPLGELAHTEAAGAGRQGPQDPRRTIDGLNHRVSIAESRSTL